MAINITQRTLSDVVLSALSALLVLIAAFSLQWRMMHDASCQMYLTYLIMHFNEIPYRDFFEENTLGTYVIYGMVGRLGGFSDFGFRCADIIYLGAIAVATWFWMKQLGRRVAWCGAVLFGVTYLGRGPVVSMQRDYLLLLPTILALLVSSSTSRTFEAARNALIGALIGFSATIKPHAALAFPLIIIFRIWGLRSDDRVSDSRRSVPAILISAIGGFLIPMAVYYLYLVRVGALGQFLEIARNYWPLYHSLTGYHTTISSAQRFKYLLLNLSLFGGYRLWFVPAACGVYAAISSSALTAVQKRQVYLLIAMAVCYSLYVVSAGKFWPYHWLPFLYFMVQLSSLCLVEQTHVRHEWQARFPAAVLLVTIFMMIRPPAIFLAQMGGRPIPPPKGGRVDEIAAYLKAHMRPGDKVQPLDWTGGAIHSMLIARAELATSFYYDVPFYHHVSNEYVQQLRQRFIRELTAAAPRFVIQVETDKPWVSGPDTSREFKELQFILDTEYHPVLLGNGYVIYERRLSPGLTAPL
jgi:hypothetical protein